MRKTLGKRALRNKVLYIGDEVYYPTEYPEDIAADWVCHLVGWCEHCQSGRLMEHWDDRQCEHCGAELDVLNRPCPFVGCRHNNWCDVTDKGSVKITDENVQPWEMDPQASCIFDDVFRPKVRTLERDANLDLVGKRIGGVCRERVRQIEESAQEKYRRRVEEAIRKEVERLGL